MVLSRVWRPDDCWQMEASKSKKKAIRWERRMWGFSKRRVAPVYQEDKRSVWCQPDSAYTTTLTLASSKADVMPPAQWWIRLFVAMGVGRVTRSSWTTFTTGQLQLGNTRSWKLSHEAFNSFPSVLLHHLAIWLLVFTLISSQVKSNLFV